MELKFWGTRGSCAAPFPDRSEYGGNTSCASIRSGNCWLVLDAGTGVIPLAAEIRQASMEPDAGTCCVKILLSHYHLDHIIGLPMFLAALPKTADVVIYTVPPVNYSGCIPYSRELDSLIGPPLWPVKLTDVCRQLRFSDIHHQEKNDIGEGILVSAMPSNHPNNTSIYRILWHGREIVYGLDCEITDDFEENYICFAQNCDYLIFDGAYADEDYSRCVGFGHSAVSRSLAIAQKTAAKYVYITHYDYAYSDTFLHELEALYSDQNCILFSREGMSLEITHAEA